jgi:hypothetical protein
MSRQIFTLIVLLGFSSFQNLGASDECSRTTAMEVYSNAFAHEETGDVLGYELAVKRHDDSTVEAFFYVYEGAPNNEAIPLSGRLSGKRLSIQGDWVEHLIEYPSKKEIVQTHVVKITGVLDSASFRGVVTIEGMAERELVRLKRVKSIWLCTR